MIPEGELSFISLWTTPTIHGRSYYTVRTIVLYDKCMTIKTLLKHVPKVSLLHNRGYFTSFLDSLETSLQKSRAALENYNLWSFLLTCSHMHTVPCIQTSFLLLSSFRPTTVCTMHTFQTFITLFLFTGSTKCQTSYFYYKTICDRHYGFMCLFSMHYGVGIILTHSLTHWCIQSSVAEN